MGYKEEKYITDKTTEILHAKHIIEELLEAILSANEIGSGVNNNTLSS